MAKGRALKEEMMMKRKDMPMKDKQGFPKVPKEHEFADDLGYFTKAKALPKRPRGK